MNYKEGEIIELDEKEYIIYSIIQDGEKYYFLGCTNYTQDGKGCNRMMTYREYRKLVPTPHWTITK